LIKRDVVKQVLAGHRPPYVPWSFEFTVEAGQKLRDHFGDALEGCLDNHIVKLGRGNRLSVQIAPDLYRDIFGVEWDRSRDTGWANEQLRRNGRGKRPNVAPKFQLGSI
jgi:uroporphyrinogen decarboxylase